MCIPSANLNSRPALMRVCQFFNAINVAHEKQPIIKYLPKYNKIEMHVSKKDLLAGFLQRDECTLGIRT